MAKKEAAEQNAKGGSKKIIIIVLIALIVLVGGGVAAYLLLGKEEPLSPEEEQAALEQQAGQVGPMVSLEAFIVNILDDQESRYLKAAVTLEVDQEKAAAEVNQRMPQIKDAILLLIGNKTFDELRDMQGKIQLRAELINRLNSILQQGKVKRIYFTDFVVQ